MKRKLSFGTLLFASTLFIFSSSCKKEVSDVNPDENISSSAVGAGTGSTEARMLESQLLKSLRQATSRYNSTSQAIQAGYQPETHCVSSPAGGMGYHWAKSSLVDPVFNPLEPEVVLYATGPGGNLKLVAVEFVVINVGQQRPSFDGQLFDIGGAPIPVPHWTLHVWVHEYNPSGTFAKFNPNVTCP